MNVASTDTRYKRVLTTKDLILLGLSMTIGSGIFVLIDDVAKYSKNLVWLSFVLAGVIGLLTAMGYGELSSIFKNNMGEADYIRSVTNDKIAHIMGICILISDIFIISTVALGLGNYLSKLFGINVQILAIMSIIALNYFNYLGIRLSVNVSNAMLYIKLVVIFLIVIICFTKYSPTEPIFSVQNGDSYGLSTASLIALFAYLGFNNMTNFSEETIDPGRTIGKSMTYTVIIVTIIYTLVAFAALFVLNSTELSQTTTPLATITEKMFGSYGYILFIILAIISLSDTLLVSSVSESRYMHSFFSHINQNYGQADMDQHHKTPYLSIIVLVIMSIILIAIFKNIGATAIYGDLLILIVFIIVNLIVIILRYKHPEMERKYQVPFNIGKIPVPSVIAIILGCYTIYKYIGHVFQ